MEIKEKIESIVLKEFRALKPEQTCDFTYSVSMKDLEENNGWETDPVAKKAAQDMGNTIMDRMLKEVESKL